MKEWQYKIAEFTEEPPSVNYLNSQGEKLNGGWELTAMVQTQRRLSWLSSRDVAVYVAYFKRPK